MTIPSSREIYDWLKDIRAWLDKRKKQFLFRAWENANLGDIYKVLIEYYGDLHQRLFSYPRPDGTRVTVPLYVAPGWDSMSAATLRMHFEDTLRPFHPTQVQEDFFEFYCELKRRESGRETWPMHDAPIFRLVDFDTTDDILLLHFELGKFPYSVMCQTILEHEVITLLAKVRTPKRNKFKLRNSMAANASMMRSFFHTFVGRIGINNLILLRAGQDIYAPMVHKRSGLTMSQAGLWDAVSSCIFEVATEAQEDFNLQHTALREAYEELFDKRDIAQQTRHVDPRFFYKEDGIADLVKLIDNGSAVFEITGFCIDLVRMVPEITTLLLVRDESYYYRHYSPKKRSVASFQLNPEFERPSSPFVIPNDINDVEAYLSSLNFDPMHWTLPGAFSFYQGLKRSLDKSLL